MAAVAALVIGLLATTYATLEMKKVAEREASNRFQATCDQLMLKIVERLKAYSLLLRGGDGLFDASENVTREEWRRYVDSLHAAETVPGHQGIGYSMVIPSAELASHTKRMRDEGHPDYKVWPEGPRDPYSSIVYLEPFAGRNLRAFGFDMLSEPTRRAAMERARDTGEPALSGKVTLVQEDGHDQQAGTLMYVPVYRHEQPLETAAQRRTAILGWVYSPYRMKDLMTGIVHDWTVPGMAKLDLHIYDGEKATPESLLFDSDPRNEPDVKPPFLTTREIEFNGTRWLLLFNGGDVASRVNYAPAWATAVAGSVISLLLFVLLVTLDRRSEAQKSAESLAAQIRGMAFYDSLTELPNRRLLHDRFEMALAAGKRTRRPGALMMVDLDNFKPLNDDKGHAAGDLLLIEVARRLRTCVRETDTVARLGGDEFVVLLRDLGSGKEMTSDAAAAVAEKIREALSQPYSLDLGGGKTIVHRCSSSIGVALFSEADQEQSEVIKRADEAMYKAKKTGRDRVVVAPAPGA